MMATLNGSNYGQFVDKISKLLRYINNTRHGARFKAVEMGRQSAFVGANQVDDSVPRAAAWLTTTVGAIELSSLDIAIIGIWSAVIVLLLTLGLILAGKCSGGRKTKLSAKQDVEKGSGVGMDEDELNTFIGRCDEHATRCMLDPIMKRVEAEQETFEEQQTKEYQMGCRIPHMPIQASSKVGVKCEEVAPPITLNMNTFANEIGQKIVIAMAPLQTEAFLYWAAVFQEEIGTLVLVINEDAPWYLQMVNRALLTSTINHTDSNVIDVSTIEARDLWYGTRLRVNAMWKRKRGNTWLVQTRKVAVFLVNEWLNADDYTLKTNAGWTRDGTDRSRFPELAQEIEESERQHGGLMVACLTGLDHSVILIAAYLGWKKWKSAGIFDPIGPLKLIGRIRPQWHALRSTSPARIMRFVASVARLLKESCRSDSDQDDKQGDDQDDDQGDDQDDNSGDDQDANQGNDQDGNETVNQ